MGMKSIERRKFVFLLVALASTAAQGAPSYAKDGDSGGEGGDGDGGGGGEGGDSGGGGGGNSGPGGGGDYGDGDDGDEKSGRGRNRGRRDEERARAAVRDGKAMSLKDARKRVAEQYGGRIIGAQLRNASNGLVYEFRIVSDKGTVRSVTMDATTGKFAGFLGF